MSLRPAVAAAAGRVTSERVSTSRDDLCVDAAEILQRAMSWNDLQAF
jgi:hypothetical protein